MAASTSSTSDPSSPQRFAGRVALITGVSDRGIGGAIAERLASEGAQVSLTGLDEPKKLLKGLEANGDRFLWNSADLSDPEVPQQLVMATADKFGQLDILVNNAGIETMEPLASMTDSQWDEIVGVNLTAVMRMSRAALSQFADRAAAIINIASVLGIAGSPAMTAYSATKAGVIGMTRSLALELAPQGIRVNAIAPAMVKTPMIMRYANTITDAQWRQIQAAHPLGIGAPSDVAAAVAFLASREAKWITGATLPLGWTQSYSPAFEELSGE
jgi:NAD(P)-dependent dehydrogenase (short-subunit alcohol dehydrogenase family)